MPRRESVFFYTFHKCASSLFSGYVLPNARGLEHCDYATPATRGDALQIAFQREGFVYGPIRLSADPASRVHALFVSQCATEDFVRDRLCTFLVRDPRDILVSRYYWVIARPEGLAKKPRDERRSEVAGKSIDEFALETAPLVAGQFAIAARLLAACPRGVLLRYEDMVDDWPMFERGLLRHFDFAPEVLAEIRMRARPVQTEDVTAHKRSGRTGGHREKLRAETIRALDGSLGEALRAFRYEPSIGAMQARA